MIVGSSSLVWPRCALCNTRFIVPCSRWVFCQERGHERPGFFRRALTDERIEVTVVVGVTVFFAKRHRVLAFAAGEQRERRRHRLGRALHITRAGAQ